MLNQFQEVIENLLGPKPGSKRKRDAIKKPSCLRENDPLRKRERCDVWQLGCLCRALREEKLSFQEFATLDRIRKSPFDFMKRLERLAGTIDRLSLGKTHEACNVVLPLISSMMDLREQLDLELTDEQNDHLREQALNMGVKPT